MTVVLATRNPGKVRELRELLAPLALEVRSLADFAGMPPTPEEALSLEENASAKAWAACRFTGMVSLGEDTGLEVDALDGAPGARAARYFGEGLTDGERMRWLLGSLAHIPPGRRGARFCCALAIVEPGGRQWIVTGACRGAIAEAARGTAGFGYDPVFLAEGTGRTLAELDLPAKNALSHRGRAVRAAAPILERLVQEAAEGLGGRACGGWPGSTGRGAAW